MKSPFAPRLSAVSIVLLALIGVALLLDARVGFRGDRDEIPLAAMERARAEVLSRKKPGDLVVFSPIFSMREIAGLGDLPARPDLPAPEVRSSRRVLVIDYAPYPMYGFGRPAEVLSIADDLELRIFEPTGDRALVLFDLYSDWERASQRIERPRGTVTSQCNGQRGEGGRSCPGEPEWLYLAQRQLVIEGKNTPCIWNHPTNGGDVIITLPAMPEPPAGRRLELVLSGGMTDDAVNQTSDGAEVRTDVEQQGRKIGEIVAPNKIGWMRAQIAIEPGKPVDLRTSTPRDGRRHYCLNAQITEVAGR